ncbi:MAG TPA: hypothetical protein VGD64_16310 [Acidisarcina sp.]
MDPKSNKFELNGPWVTLWKRPINPCIALEGISPRLRPVEQAGLKEMLVELLCLSICGELQMSKSHFESGGYSRSMGRIDTTRKFGVLASY